MDLTRKEVVMGRAGILIKQDELLAELLEAEETAEFDSYSELYEYVSGSDWGQNQMKTDGNEGIATASVISLRVTQWDLKKHLKTTKGDVGKGIRNGNKGSVREARSVKMNKRTDKQEIEDALNESLGTPNGKYDKLIKQVMKGSMPAIVKAKCLDCTCLQVYEIKNCTMKGCALYAVRPFQE